MTISERKVGVPKAVAGAVCQIGSRIEHATENQVGTVEGHLNAMEEAAETRRCNKRMKELEAQDEDRRRGLGGPVSKVLRFVGAYIRKKPIR
jgi:hypothetical protein